MPSSSWIIVINETPVPWSPSSMHMKSNYDDDNDGVSGVVVVVGGTTTTSSYYFNVANMQ